MSPNVLAHVDFPWLGESKADGYALDIMLIVLTLALARFAVALCSIAAIRGWIVAAAGPN